MSRTYTVYTVTVPGTLYGVDGYATVDVGLPVLRRLTENDVALVLASGVDDREGQSLVLAHSRPVWPFLDSAGWELGWIKNEDLVALED